MNERLLNRMRRYAAIDSTVITSAAEDAEFVEGLLAAARAAGVAVSSWPESVRRVIAHAKDENGLSRAAAQQLLRIYDGLPLGGDQPRAAAPLAGWRGPSPGRAAQAYLGGKLRNWVDGNGPSTSVRDDRDFCLALLSEFRVSNYRPVGSEVAEVLREIASLALPEEVRSAYEFARGEFEMGLRGQGFARNEASAALYLYDALRAAVPVARPASPLRAELLREARLAAEGRTTTTFGTDEELARGILRGVLTLVGAGEGQDDVVTLLDVLLDYPSGYSCDEIAVLLKAHDALFADPEQPQAETPETPEPAPGDRPEWEELIARWESLQAIPNQDAQGRPLCRLEVLVGMMRYSLEFETEVWEAVGLSAQESFFEYAVWRTFRGAPNLTQSEAEAVVETFRERTSPVYRRIRELEAELAELRARGGRS